jgi:hypothetical protein
MDADEVVVVSKRVELVSRRHAGSAAFVRQTPYAHTGWVAKMPLGKAGLVAAMVLAWPIGVTAQTEERVAFERAVQRVVEEFRPHVVPIVDPRPVSSNLDLFSEGLPSLFVESSEDVAERRRDWLRGMEVMLGDAVLGSRCWATPGVLTVAGEEPDTAAARAVEERERRCQDEVRGGVYLVLSLPRADPGSGGTEYRVVGYGDGCVWGWDVVVPEGSADAELNGGIDTCT